MTGLIDTTEMYLRTIFELEEEGIPPLRARIAERLGQSGPTVSQTVARMERDDLLAVEGNRRIRLSRSGRAVATRVMRRHRLAECLLVDVLGIPWEDAHLEACRWEHVVSEPVERRVLEVLGHPSRSPFGNPIPGLAELDDPQADGAEPAAETLVEATAESGTDPIRVVISRFDEPAQADPALMRSLRRCGARPGESVNAQRSPGGVLTGSAGEYTEIDLAMAIHVLVRTRAV